MRTTTTRPRIARLDQAHPARAHRNRELLSAHARVGSAIADAGMAGDRWAMIEPILQAAMREAHGVITLVEADAPDRLPPQAAQLIEEPLSPVMRVRALAFLEQRLRAALRAWHEDAAPDWVAQAVAHSAARVHRLAAEVEVTVAAHAVL